jgi:hypothetical protein
MKATYTRQGGVTEPVEPLTYAEREALRQANANAPKPSPTHRGLGDAIEAAVKPLAKALGVPCLDASGRLKPSSPCAKLRDALNQNAPFSAP